MQTQWWIKWFTGDYVLVRHNELKTTETKKKPKKNKNKSNFDSLWLPLFLLHLIANNVWDASPPTKHNENSFPFYNNIQHISQRKALTSKMKLVCESNSITYNTNDEHTKMVTSHCIRSDMPCGIIKSNYCFHTMPQYDMANER